MKKYKDWIISGKFLYSGKLAVVLWFGLSAIALLLTLHHHTGFNNFIIFNHVFTHVLEQKNLYLFYPAEYDDVNLYGPLFSILIAPFAVLKKYFHFYPTNCSITSTIL